MKSLSSRPEAFVMNESFGSVYKTRTSVFRDKAVVVAIEVVEVVGVVIVNVKTRGQHIVIELKYTIKATTCIIKIENKL